MGKLRLSDIAKGIIVMAIVILVAIAAITPYKEAHSALIVADNNVATQKISRYMTSYSFINEFGAQCTAIVHSMKYAVSLDCTK